MDIATLKAVLAPLYAQTPGIDRWEDAERLLRLVEGWLPKEDPQQDLDRTQLKLLPCLIGIREAILKHVSIRTQVEGLLVEHGFTPMRIRDVMRALERLPDRPRSDEEKLVADAYTLTQLGMGGFVRQLMHGAVTGAAFAAIQKNMQKALGRRVFTKAASREVLAKKDRLRALSNELQEELQLI